MNKKDFFNRCFSPNWIEVDLEEVQKLSESSTVHYEEKGNETDLVEQRTTEQNKEDCPESQRKDLNTLLKELDEIKKSIEMAAEKQHRLANLMVKYTGNFAQ